MAESLRALSPLCLPLTVCEGGGGPGSPGPARMLSSFPLKASREPLCRQAVRPAGEVG
jgi:hypothetical protein